MGEKIVVGPINGGLRSDRTAFVIDNDSFPTLTNAYQWRGRVKRKRGTSFLNRLKRFFNSLSPSYSSVSTTPLAAMTGIGNILIPFSLQANGNIVPGSVTITVGMNTYTDGTQDGFLVPKGPVLGPFNTINYATGVITIPAEAGNSASVVFNYYPDLPVMGLEDLQLISTQFPTNLAFDTKYSYNLINTYPYSIYDVSFYKNPTSGAYPAYVQKTNATPTTWNGQNYQQFWTVNYEGALWATNGINIPFSTTNIGMQFKLVTNVSTIVAGPPATATFTIATHGLVVGDFLYFNEFNTAVVTGLNFQTGYVIAVIDGNNVSVEFPTATLGGAGGATATGIAQYLTNRSDVTKDCIRYYDGDPTNGNVTTPTLTPGHGWVNFAPPLMQAAFSIGNLPPAIYYLVGARMIVPFKDRLLFLGVVVGTSSGAVFYLQDTVVYSQNGTPYYTCTFTGDPLNPTKITPVLVPDNQTATPSAYFSDQTGFGGFITAGISQPITTSSLNEDVLIVGFSATQTKLLYSGDDLIPFVFYSINSEYGSASTFSTINTDAGVINRGTRGYIMTSQTDCKRIDLQIPDEVFEINLLANGNERVCSARDFINEWIYFTYTANTEDATFPNQTLLFNYRDNSWAKFEESYTTYGYFRRQTGFTWQTVGFVYPTWAAWTEPWNAGTSTLLQQEVIAGNQQGFVIARDEGTGEGTSLYIQSFSGVTNIVTSPSHNLEDEDYIIITGAIGDVAEFVNGETFQVQVIDKDTFQLSPDPLIGSASYAGGGLITKISVPDIQTKQFPVAWGISRKVRLGPQQYLLTTTNNSQITLLIFLSQNSASAYNEGTIVPNKKDLVNSSLIYSTILYTCPESTNLGLTAANTNLQMPTAIQQEQIWHRVNTSLIGDTIQIGFTLSDAQIRDLENEGTAFPITGASKAIECVLTCAGRFESGQLIEITGVVGMIQLNGNRYQVISSDATTVTINVNSLSFSTYVSGGLATPVGGINAFAEIEIHGFSLDVTPSQMLC